MSEIPEPKATSVRRIEFSDTDASGRYHYATALRLFEAAESDLLAQLGLLDEIYTSMPRKKISFEYHHVLEFMDEVEATVGVEKLGRTSLTYKFEVTRRGELCVTGELVVVFVDSHGNPQAWDERHRKLLSVTKNSRGPLQ